MLLVQVNLVNDINVEFVVTGGLVIDVQLVVTQRDGVAWYANNALDQQLFVSWGVEGDNFTAPRVAPLAQLPARKGNLEIVGELIDDNTITFEDGGLHGAGWYLVTVGDGRAEQHHNDEEDDTPIQVKCIKYRSIENIEALRENVTAQVVEWNSKENDYGAEFDLSIVKLIVDRAEFTRDKFEIFAYGVWDEDLCQGIFDLILQNTSD